MARTKREKKIWTFLLGVVMVLTAALFVWILLQKKEVISGETVNGHILEALKIQENLDSGERAEEVRSLQEAYSAEINRKRSEAEREEKINSFFAGSHLIAHQVVYDCDDSDIPYIRNLFSHCLVIGNSRAKNVRDCGILSENEVKDSSGTPVAEMIQHVKVWAHYYAPKTLFIMGLNDVAYYDCDAEAFYNDYKTMVEEYLAVNSNSEIYIMESLPLPPEAEPYFYRAYRHLPAFNDAMKRLCEDCGWNYVTATPYADFQYINSEDHAHYNKDFYFLWAQTMANQMHLWEDVAGIKEEP